MNKQLIEKIITSNNLPCPDFAFENPLLDRNVAKALSKSFVKILNVSQENSKVNKNLRFSILENLRRVCQVEPEKHISINEDITVFLSDAYEKEKLNSEITDATSKILDEFLVQNVIDMNINSSYNTSLNPEVVQALINLNENGMYLNVLYKDIIHWNSTNNKNLHILKDLWANGNFKLNEVSVKLKSELEKILLEICLSLLNNTDCDVEELFVSNADLKNLVRRSSDSSSCFQISCSILNSLFLMTNFAPCIQKFVQRFVESVKQSCTHITFSVLYPTHLSHIVVLLDIEKEKLPMSLQESYIQEVVKYMLMLKSASEDDFLMLLSHFPNWFDICTSIK